MRGWQISRLSRDTLSRTGQRLRLEGGWRGWMGSIGFYLHVLINASPPSTGWSPDRHPRSCRPQHRPLDRPPDLLARVRVHINAPHLPSFLPLPVLSVWVPAYVCAIHIYIYVDSDRLNWTPPAGLALSTLHTVRLASSYVAGHQTLG